jgi:hypothetical protein
MNHDEGIRLRTTSHWSEWLNIHLLLEDVGSSTSPIIDIVSSGVEVCANLGYVL